jgi:serine/threonine protein kinase
MTSANARHLKVGAGIGPDLTVLGVVDKQQRNPVYIVWHHRAWCPMACKLFPTYERARREAGALSQLDHPNTVRFLGIGKPAHLLMEFLEGPTLDRMIRMHKKQPMSVSNVMRVAIHIGSALQHVHERGLIHLDVKPSNVIVVRGRPVLYDFGTARQRDARRPKQIVGTDPYIAPEECQQLAVTSAADIFSLGVTIYEMLTGELPFPSGTRSQPFPQVHRPAVPLRRHRARVPRRLEDLVLGCLAPDPAARPGIPVLLPALHDFIRSGPPMWPPDFRPGLHGSLNGRRRSVSG